jgi:hypothetical protein
MRRLGLASSLLALMTMLGATTVSASARSPFEGAWTSTDPGDGSTQHLYVTGGTNVAMIYVDEFGTTCVNHEARTVVFTGRLTGHVAGDDLFAWFKQGGCGPIQIINASMGIGWSFQYDRNTDTLLGPVEEGPVIWYRD